MDVVREERDEYMLTTVDNPFNPFTQFNEWLAWDSTSGYHSPGLLARISMMNDELSDADQSLALSQAIDEIIRENVSGAHMKLSRSMADQRFGSAES